MEGDAAAAAAARIPFQLQFDKPIPFQVKMAEWNPEKDLLAMVTEDSRVLLHRFNWQRLWTISPGKCITSLCWRPDGKVIALGLEDGSISLHDVENGKLVRSVKFHNVAVVCLNWEEDTQLEDDCNIFTYEDRTLRFFPLAPRIPRPPGLGSGDNGLMEESEDSFQQLSKSSLQRFNILCSGDKDGCICFNIFGIFPIGKINIHELPISTSFLDEQNTYQLQKASIHKVALAKNLCKLIVLTLGELVEESVRSKDKSTSKQGGVELNKSPCVTDSSTGLHCMLLNTSIFLNRKNEFYQVAQQASSIEDSLEVVRVSLSLMPKQWSDAMHSFHEKFDPLASLIIDHGLESSPQEEFISLLCGARTSPPLHQFLVNSLGEVGLKRVCKAVDAAGKELQLIIREHLQPAVEIIGFRIGELRGLSRWRARFKNIGLDETLIDNATEKTGMLLVQVERLLRVLTIVIFLFQNFFTWLLKCIKTLMSEPVDEIQPFNSELVIIFLKFLLDHDPVGQLLEHSEVRNNIDVDLDTMQRIEELVAFGGFLDTKFLERNLVKEFNQLEQCFKEAFLMPFTTVSKKILCEDLLPMYPTASSSSFLRSHAPTSIAYYKGNLDSASDCLASKDSLVDYMCFRVPDESLGVPNSIAILRGFIDDTSSDRNVINNLRAVLLCIPDEYHCVDLSLYKENQIILLLNEAISSTENPEKSLMMMVQTSDLSFVSLPRFTGANLWKLHEMKALAVNLCMGNGKVRHISHSITAPLAVSASRGVACAFATKRHALVYILDEDEDDVSEME